MTVAKNDGQWRELIQLTPETFPSDALSVASSQGGMPLHLPQACPDAIVGQRLTYVLAGGDAALPPSWWQAYRPPAGW